MAETIQLRRPVKTKAGKEITEVTVEGPVMTGDWRVAARQAKGDTNELSFYLVCRMTGLEPVDLEKLVHADFQKCVNALDTGDDDPKAPSSSSP